MLRVHLLHDHREVFSGQASQVVLPAIFGELSVLEWHAPMLCALTEGEIQIDEQRFSVRRGLAGVARNTVTIVSS